MFGKCWARVTFGGTWKQGDTLDCKQQPTLEPRHITSAGLHKRLLITVLSYVTYIDLVQRAHRDQLHLWSLHKPPLKTLVMTNIFYTSSADVIYGLDKMSYDWIRCAAAMISKMGPVYGASGFSQQLTLFPVDFVPSFPSSWLWVDEMHFGHMQTLP